MARGRVVRRVQHRATITCHTRHFDTHKKQTGGTGQFANASGF
jgi:hypothetical protein